MAANFCHPAQIQYSYPFFFLTLSCIQCILRKSLCHVGIIEINLVNNNNNNIKVTIGNTTIKIIINNKSSLLACSLPPGCSRPCASGIFPHISLYVCSHANFQCRFRQGTFVMQISLSVYISVSICVHIAGHSVT